MKPHYIKLLDLIYGRSTTRYERIVENFYITLSLFSQTRVRWMP